MGRVRHKPLYETTRGRCFYCGVPIRNGGRFADKRDWLLVDPQHIFVREHKTPQSRGGRDDRRNYVPSCGRYNKIKHNFTIDEFRCLEGLRRRDPQFVFAFEKRAPVNRDWLCVHSLSFEKSLLAHNFPGSERAYRMNWMKEYRK